MIFLTNKYYLDIEDAWNRGRGWLADTVLSRPRATEYYTVAELEKLGYVGVYRLMPMEKGRVDKWADCGMISMPTCLGRAINLSNIAPSRPVACWQTGTSGQKGALFLGG